MNENSQSNIYKRIINKTEDYVNDHLSDKITLNDVAKHAGFSTYHFHRIFKEYSDETLNEFILRFKLERSAIYLKVNKRVSITEVSLAYGFNDSSNYSRAFKRHFGITPSQFRKQQDLSSLTV